MLRVAVGQWQLVRNLRTSCHGNGVSKGQNPPKYKSIENLRTSQTCELRILQYFATKIWNFTTFKGSFREFRFFLWICLDQKLFYNAIGITEIQNWRPGTQVNFN